ncbi:MAG: hypothetical protein KME20_05245 [Kaiparowitsia implicata GSE-PSE-MK54-09C]|jgi:hypothetical protein|nr:hypothetical protein [Kaiparowitsia implicata GSE-PSE-MK54-09C]
MLGANQLFSLETKMLDKQGGTPESTEKPLARNDQSTPQSPSNVNQSISQDGKFNTVIKEGTDVQVGHRYYGPTVADIRAIVQTTLQVQSVPTPTELVDLIPENPPLPTLIFEPQLANHLNTRLAALDELRKLGYLPQQHLADFNQVKEKVLQLMEVQQELSALAAKADILLQAGVDNLTAKLQALESSQDNSLLEARSQACLQEQIKLLQQFREELEDGKVVARWLDRKRANGLARTLGKYTLQHYPDIQISASQGEIDAFYFTLDQFLENLSHCLTWGRKSSLENPITPIVIEDELYIFALEYLGFNLLPENLPSHSVVQLQGYIAYLVERLPDYEHIYIG